MKITHLKTRRGGNTRLSGIAGTWLHPKLAAGDYKHDGRLEVYCNTVDGVAFDASFKSIENANGLLIGRDRQLFGSRITAHDFINGFREGG